MSELIDSMLERYHCQTQADYEHALHEIIQEIALLGLWRSKFFEHAAFYGGTALRVLYGLDRFSEDLDFSLLTPDASFNLAPYNKAIKAELDSFGFDAQVMIKQKKPDNTIWSAFIKANTRQQFLNIQVSHRLIQQVHRDKAIKIKMEVDIDPPMSFQTETKLLLEPIPFSVNSYTLPCLFAGKLHALLCRAWKNRVKGRDWYDFVWYVKKNVAPDISHLRQRLIQTGHWSEKKSLDLQSLNQLLLERIEHIDFEQAKDDVRPFVNDPDSLALWSKEFFTQLSKKHFRQP